MVKKKPEKLLPQIIKLLQSWRPLREYVKGDMVIQQNTVWRAERDTPSGRPGSGSQDGWKHVESNVPQPETTKPCPGCGDRRRRPTDRVCHACCSQLEELSELRDKLLEKIKGKQVLIGMRQHHNMLPYFSGRQYNTEDGRGDISRQLVELIESIAVPAAKEASRNDSVPLAKHTKNKGAVNEHWHSYYADEQLVMIPVGVHKAFQNLFDAIVELADSRYKEGFERGNSLLAELASNETSLAEYNERSMKKGH